ncbi:carbohydrate ABC transporter permease [Acidipropionibacterium acidipropionici]|uniref:carbohydrate ABC transporter permease n=1 Tax=Acidipropionibacterium acidipropionici TaxID=1748 RepID=UPI0005644F7B|nr:sugar ABC transporter permease [Acidipropionibacterium acidipropionici]ALN14089.1 glycerol-3-phosphate ABC transporter permease [Acidipropionibacterium acidipropionici]APZ10147.1 glycerol-3-phosphate ABC transporter permease [Acidipropionibacterium acidipropionici]
MDVGSIDVLGARARGQFGRRRVREALLFVALVVPNAALIAVFTYRPLILNIWYSLLDWTLGSPRATFIGLGNYREFFSRDAAGVLGTTLIFTVATVGGSMLIGLGLAVVLNRRLIGRNLARATVFAPYVLSGVGVGLVWTFIFDPVGGVLAAILRGFGASSPQWFLQPSLALTMVIIVYIWKNLGYCAVIYLAALQAVPRDLLEAASLDGAGHSRIFRAIIWPLISPTTFFLLMTTILSSLQAFDLIRIMTPMGQGTTTLMYASYLQAFGGYNRAGYSAVISTVLVLILLLLTVIQMRLLERKVHYA